MADVDMQEGTSTQTRCRSIQERFRAYSSELDEHHDRRERIIKTSRDVTAQSKKVIFNLHRITQSKPERVLRESKAKLEEIQKLLETLQEDLEGERYWRCVGLVNRQFDIAGPEGDAAEMCLLTMLLSAICRYQRQISPGIQEYVSDKLR